jgi:hypothetical protein
MRGEFKGKKRCYAHRKQECNKINKIGVGGMPRLGDSINTLPALDWLHKEFPDSLIFWETNHQELAPAFVQPCQHLPEVDRKIWLYKFPPKPVPRAYEFLEIVGAVDVAPSWHITEPVEKDIEIVFCPKSSSIVKDWPYKLLSEAVEDRGERSLPELIELINRAKIVVGADSGPIHLASALGAVPIGLYRKDKFEFFRPVNDSYCIKADRMSDIQPEQVEAVLSSLKWRLQAVEQQPKGNDNGS